MGADWGELTVARLEIDLGKAWELKATGDDYVGSLQRACEAVGRTIGFDDREIQRMRKVARLVVPVPPKDALNGMAAVAERIPPKPRQRFSKKVDVVLQLVAQRPRRKVVLLGRRRVPTGNQFRAQQTVRRLYPFWRLFRVGTAIPMVDKHHPEHKLWP